MSVYQKYYKRNIPFLKTIMGKCSIKCCNNRNDRKSPKRVRVFSFPRKEEIRKKWLEICKITGNDIHKSAFICEDHFVEADYKPKPEYLQNCPGFIYSPRRRRIKDDAIPSLNLVPDDEQIQSANVQNKPVGPHSFQCKMPKVTQDSVSLKEIESAKEQNIPESPQSLQDDHSQCVEHYELGSKNSKKNLKRRSSEDLEKLTELEELKRKLHTVEEENEIIKMKYTSIQNKYTKVVKKYKALCNRLDKEVHRKSNIQNHLNNLKFENVTLKKDLRKSQKIVQKHEQMEAAVQNVLTGKQIHKMMHPNLKHVHWDTETTARAISLCSFSGSAYKYLKITNYPLPSRACIRRWGSLMQIQEGILHDIIYMMEGKGHLLEAHQKLIVLSFDEVYLNQRMDICKKREKVIGPHKTAQVCFARGLFMSWKQPIFYNFDQALTKEILDDIIKELYRINYIVVAVVTDLGGGNPQAFKKYKIGIEENENAFFIHPCDEKLKIFVFADVPHLFKLFRNHFLDYGYEIDELENGQIVTKYVNKKILEELLSIEQDNELKIAFKLTKEQIDVRGAKRQNVAKATKLISKSNARAMRWYGNENLLNYEDWRLSADVFELMNRWFDTFNSKFVYGYSLGQEGYGLNLAEQDDTLSRVTELMYSLKFGKQEALRPFQRGIILNNTSLKEFLKYLQKTYDTENFKITYILTNRLNQDVLENFFAIIRAMGRTHDHPSALEFEYRLKSYILGKHAAVILSRYKNAEDDNDKCLVGLSEGSKKCSQDKLSKDDAIPNLIKESDLPAVEKCDDKSFETIDESWNETQKFSTDMIAQDFEVEAIDDLQDTVDGAQNNQPAKSKVDCLRDLIILLGIDENNEYSEEINKDQNTDEEKMKNKERIKALINFQSLGFVAGYTAFHLRIEYPFLGFFTSKPNENAQEDLTWLLTISDGWLRLPSKRWFQAAIIIDKVFDGFHGDETLSKESEIFSKVTDIAFQEIQIQLNTDSSQEIIPREAVLLQVQTRTFFRLRRLQFLRKQAELTKKIERQKKQQETIAKKNYLSLQGEGVKEQRHVIAKINKFLALPMCPH